LTSPTAHTLARLRDLGFIADVVERWLPRANRKRDLFGLADVLAVHPRDRLVLLVQATTLAHVADRLERVRSRPEAALLLRAGVGIEVWGWYERGGRWRPRRVAVRAADLRPVLLDPRPRRRGRKGERQGLLFEAAGPPAAEGQYQGHTDQETRP
jgi:hypothetical protein